MNRNKNDTYHVKSVYQLLVGLVHLLKTGNRTFFEQPDLINDPYGENAIQREYGRFAFWFAEWLGGIQPDHSSPGFRHFRLNPFFPENLDFAR